MTVAGRTAQPLQPAAPFARWSAVLAAGLGCLALAVVVATFPLGSGLLVALNFAAAFYAELDCRLGHHLALWITEVAS
jgi:hypothetical protein